MNLFFSYNERRELIRVNSLILKRDFFAKYYPEKKLDLPEGISLESKPTEEELLKVVRKELDPMLAGSTKKEIENFYQNNQLLIEKFFKEHGLTLPGELVIIFTKYGSSSGYHYPNYLILNMKTPRLYGSFIHELVHLPVEEKYVRPFDLTQKEKESLVEYFIMETPAIHNLVPTEKYDFGPPSEGLLKRIGLIR